MPKKLPLPDLRTIKQMALDAYCSEPTMKKALRGQKVQPTILAKIRQTLVTRGEDHLLGACE